MRSLTASTTAIVFSPDCLRMESATVGRPLRRATVCKSSAPSSTRPTSLRRTSPPSRSRTTRSPISSTLSALPRMRSPASCPELFTLPAGICTFCCFKACSTSLAVSMNAFSRTGSSHTLICRFRAPSSVTCPTPATLSNCRRSTLSAYSLISRTGLSATSEMLMMGSASGSSFSTIGASILSGSVARMRFTRSRTSCAATSTFLSRLNETSTWEMPSVEVERSSSIPLTVLTASSILSVISVSISFGVAPSSRVRTITEGKSTFGKRSTGSRV